MLLLRYFVPLIAAVTFPSAPYLGDDIPASVITPSVKEFMEYDSVVVFLAVARAYIAKFFVAYH